MPLMKHAGVLLLVTVVSANVKIYQSLSGDQVDIEFPGAPSLFGREIPIGGINAFLVYAHPNNTGCSKLNPPPTNVTNFTGHWAVLISRGGCDFEPKIRNAQNASYDLVIVHNINSNALERMVAKNPDGINIASIFVGSQTGEILNRDYLFDKGYFINVDADPYDINSHVLIPFVVVVTLCFLTMIAFVVSMIIKCVRDYRRSRRHRLPNSSLRKIPTAKFRKGDPYEVCAICLDDFVEGDKLRILPCSHAYHCKCIDPWLTGSKRVCPMCKRKVFARDERVPSDSSSDDDDNTPLLRTTQRTQGGTFPASNTPALTYLRHIIDNSVMADEGSRRRLAACLANFPSEGRPGFVWNTRIRSSSSDSVSSTDSVHSAPSSFQRGEASTSTPDVHSRYNYAFTYPHNPFTEDSASASTSEDYHNITVESTDDGDDRSNHEVVV